MKTKKLKCPLCGYRLIDSAEECITELRPGDEKIRGWKPDYMQKCPKCKREIGIRKVS